MSETRIMVFYSRIQPTYSYEYVVVTALSVRMVSTNEISGMDHAVSRQTVTAEDRVQSQARTCIGPVMYKVVMQQVLSVFP